MQPTARILVVDDEKYICEIIRNVLGDDGRYEVNAVTDPAKALDLIDLPRDDVCQMLALSPARLAHSGKRFFKIGQHCLVPCLHLCLVRLVFEEGRTALEKISPPTPELTPPPASDLRRWIHMASPTEIHVTLPDGFAPGEYSLLVGFQYREAREIREHSGSVDFTIERIEE